LKIILFLSRYLVVVNEKTGFKKCLVDSSKLLLEIEKGNFNVIFSVIFREELFEKELFLNELSRKNFLGKHFGEN
jgi:hypothetical protein